MRFQENKKIKWFLFLIAGMLFTCSSIVIHEFGHFYTASMFGFKELSLHYDSTSMEHDKEVQMLVDQGNIQDIALQYHPLYQYGLISLSGPLSALFITIICFILTKNKYRPYLFVMGIQSNLIQVFFLLTLLVMGYNPNHINIDEIGAGIFLGISPTIIIGAELIIILTLFVIMSKRIPKEQIFFIWSVMPFASIFGIVLWLNYLGPLLIP